MKGIILASGSGSRLGILTQRVTSKHLLPIYDKPMVLYPLKTLVESGIDEIILVVGGRFAGSYVDVLGNGKEFNVKKLHYVYQHDFSGIAAAIGLCEEFTEGENIAVILGDNIYSSTFKEQVKSFNSGATIFIKHVGYENAKRFGVPAFDDDGNIAAIEEKPKEPQSPYCVTGMYLYDNTVFNRISMLEYSNRNELEVSALNESYMKDGLLNWEQLEPNSSWFDCGVPQSLLNASQWASRL